MTKIKIANAIRTTLDGMDVRPRCKFDGLIQLLAQMLADKVKSKRAGFIGKLPFELRADQECGEAEDLLHEFFYEELGIRNPFKVREASDA